jgi:hypothetical protein
LQDIEHKALAAIVIEGEKKARLSGAALLELRRRFDNLKGKQTILGYRRGQWIKFCNEYLKLSDRQVRRLIEATREPSPGDKRDGSANRIVQDADGNTPPTKIKSCPRCKRHRESRGMKEYATPAPPQE